MAYQTQMLHEDGYLLSPAHLLYLATLAGAEALGLGDRVGSFAPGKEADAVLVRPLEGSTLKAVLAESPSHEASLAAIFTLAREHSVAQVYVGGKAMLGSAC